MIQQGMIKEDRHFLSMAGTSLPIILLMLLPLLSLTSNLQEPWSPSEDGVVLEAEERTGIPMPRGVRDLVTTIEDPAEFDTLYPGTNLTCREVLNEHFHTNIHLGEDRNELIAMDGSRWHVSGNDVVSLTIDTVEEIAAMRYGSEENSEFEEIQSV